MPVLVVSAQPVRSSSPPLATALARWRLWLSLRTQWALVSRRGDRHLLADAAIPDTYRLACEEDRRHRDAVRHLHWML
ncbi:MAG: hypothetical protein KK482_07710 [Sinorhizobium meliloti]|jgi:hypothetical protein|uniref:hypothetical protein n=1 Tax=Sinorhizobium TaxID=28105 RepID=UPI000360FD7B|nr:MULTISPECIES: hypothetical protein [Sinorhizobium]MCG5483593.1 hypothetical protein [Sinorhizobium meliloti]PND22939.1 hypothetical protein CN934_03835 [Ensifer sp. MMN_5]PND25692.1 hypothetical protein CN933_19630 [Sinorhizobium sp. M4_45]RVQ03523.1 hypothetical protein CN070_05925 [Sinorhizobium meliloti]